MKTGVLTVKTESGLVQELDGGIMQPPPWALLWVKKTLGMRGLIRA